MYIAELYAVDFEEYPIGAARRRVGMWQDRHDAYVWVDDQRAGQGFVWYVCEVEDVTDAE